MNGHPRNCRPRSCYPTLVLRVLSVFLIQLSIASAFALQAEGAKAQTRRGASSGAKRKKAQKNRSQGESSVVLSASEVVVDVVVRDKKGRPVTGLSRSDFQVLENGKKQQIESFRIHEGEPEAGAASEEKSPNKNDGAMNAELRDEPSSTVNVVALVFDGLSPSARALAQKAALKCVADTFKPTDFAGVFSIDLTLRIFQPFTNNRALIANAINRMAVTSNSKFTETGVSALTADATQYLVTANENSGDPLNRADIYDPTGNSPSIFGLTGGRGDAVASVMNADLVHSFQTLERDQQGHAEIDALRSIVNSLRHVEGRKAVVLFSEGLAISTNTTADFRSMILEASQADVTFYTIDAGGLRAVSPISETARRLNNLAMERADSELGGGDDTSGRPMSLAMEDNETLLYRDPSAAMTQLADQTGGFFINQTNDLSPGLRRIGEDIRSYYVLTYSPINQAYDGKFRQITVKVDRPGLNVAARKGYFAVASPAPLDVPDWESPAMAILKSGRLENSFDIRAHVFSFPQNDPTELVPVMVEVPAAGLTFDVDKGSNTFKTDFAVVAVVKDLSDQIIAKVGNNYKISGPIDKLEVTRHGNVEFYREISLPPGLYFVEAVVSDNATGKSSVRGTSLEVPYYGNANDARMSSLVVVRNAKPASVQAEDEVSPFKYGDAVIYPNMGEPLSKTRDKDVSFYFDLYPAKPASNSPRVTVEVLRNNRVISRGSPVLPAPDASGRIQYSGALPLNELKPGQYTLRVTLPEGRWSLSRSANFTVQP